MSQPSPSPARRLAVGAVLLVGALVLVATSQPRWQLDDTTTVPAPRQGQAVALTFTIKPLAAPEEHGVMMNVELQGAPESVATLKQTTWSVSMGAEQVRTLRFSERGASAWFGRPDCEGGATCAVQLRLERSDEALPPEDAPDTSTRAPETITVDAETLAAVQAKVTVALEGKGDAPKNTTVTLTSP